MSLGRQVLFCPVCGLCLMIDSTPVSPDVSPVCFDVPFSLCVCLGSLKKNFFFKVLVALHSMHDLISLARD